MAQANNSCLFSDTNLHTSNTFRGKYNHKESSVSEQELLIALYAHFGAKTPENLLGDFAFALWDEQNSFFFCARDPMGHTPFYYTFHEGKFLPASSLKTLLGQLPEKPDPSLQSMREFLCQDINPGHTMYEGIYRLPPGHSMIVRDAKVEISRYWRPETIKIDYSMTLQCAKNEFRELLTDAVMSRVDDKGTTGCELSGGLDSSSIYCVAKGQDADVTAYSKRYRGMDCDEGAYIDDVLHHTESAGEDLEIGQLDFTHDYSLAHYYDKAPDWPNSQYSIGTLLLLEKMRDDGIRIVLTGQGGDHMLTGSNMMVFDLLFRGEIRAFFKEFQLLSPIRAHVLKNYIKALLGPMALLKTGRRFLKNRLSAIMCLLKCNLSYSPKNLYSKNYLQDEILHSIIGPCQSRLVDASPYRAVRERYGMLVRHPFFDTKAIEFLLSVPPNYHYSMGWHKFLLRATLQEILPKSVLGRRDKAEFSAMVKKQIDAIDKESFWKDACIVRLGIVKQCMIDRAYKKYITQGHAGRNWYWKLLNLEQWYRSNYPNERQTP